MAIICIRQFNAISGHCQDLDVIQCAIVCITHRDRVLTDGPHGHIFEYTVGQMGAAQAVGRDAVLCCRVDRASIHENVSGYCRIAAIIGDLNARLTVLYHVIQYAAAIAIVIAIVVVINMIVSQLPSNITSIDLSNEKYYTVGKTTKNVMKDISRLWDLYMLWILANL